MNATPDLGRRTARAPSRRGVPAPATTASRPSFRTEGGGLDGFDAELAVEEPLEIRVDGEPFAVVMRTPGHELELAAGFCLTEGLVDGAGDLLSIGFCPDGENIINVVTASRSRTGRAAGRNLPARTSCGLCGVRVLADLERALAPLPPGPTVARETVVNLQYRMSELQELSRMTTGSHAAALARADGEVIAVREDVGRHNALDKVIGHALLNGVDVQDAVVLLSGRVSFEMVQKAVRARIPVVAAVSAATVLAVDLAERFNVTVAGRLRDRSMVVYSHPERLRSPGENS